MSSTHLSTGKNIFSMESSVIINNYIYSIILQDRLPRPLYLEKYVYIVCDFVHTRKEFIWYSMQNKYRKLINLIRCSFINQILFYILGIYFS